MQGGRSGSKESVLQTSRLIGRIQALPEVRNKNPLIQTSCGNVRNVPLQNYPDIKDHRSPSSGDM